MACRDEARERCRTLGALSARLAERWELSSLAQWLACELSRDGCEEVHVALKSERGLQVATRAGLSEPLAAGSVEILGASKELSPAAPLDEGHPLWASLGLLGRPGIAAPLLWRDRWLGLLVARVDRCDEEDLWFFGEVASRMASAVNDRLVEAESAAMRTLVSNLPCGIAMVGKDGEGLISNDKTHEIFRIPQRTIHDLSEWSAWEGFHPDGRRLRTEEWPLARALRTGEITSGEEIEIRRGDGERAFVRINAAPVRDPSGRIAAGVVAIEDVTEQQLIKGRLESRDAQLRMIADALPVMLSLVGRDMRYRFVNRRYTEHFGTPASEIVGRTVEELLGEDAAVARPHIEAALGGRRVSYDAEFRFRGSGARIMSVDYIPCLGKDGSVDSIAVLSRDVTETRRAEDRLAFLAEASRVLASSLDIETTLEALARAAVPKIADWFFIDTLDERGNLVTSAIHHDDPDQVATFKDLRGRCADDPDARSILASGRPSLDTGGARWRTLASDDDHKALVGAFPMRSLLRVPIPTTRGWFGVLTIAAVEPSRRFVQADLSLAQELAARVGLAIDNARLLEETRRADRAKEEFIAMLAHEIRNPLAPLLSGIELLGALPADATASRDRTIAVIERQTLKLARLVDDLLDVSRINRGQIALYFERCALSGIVERALDTVRPLALARRHTLTAEIPEDLSLSADPVRLEQVLGNLLHNAIKYTEPGGNIRIAARQGDDAVEIEVSDTGIGIAPEMLSEVFLAFRQGATDRDRSQGGLGLGLALVERLVAKHGGTVRAYSEGLGRGSRFVVRLPADEAESAIVVEDSASTPPGPILRILIVDDNLDAAASAAEILRLHGHSVQTACDGPTALQRAAEDRYDAVLLDLGLPGMDGYAVARALKAMAHPPHVIALSGYGCEEDRVLSKQAGCDAHLVKPADMGTLLRALNVGSRQQ